MTNSLIMPSTLPTIRRYNSGAVTFSADYMTLDILNFIVRGIGPISFGHEFQIL